MSFLDSRDSLFEFNFPITFFPDIISKKYEKYINKIPGGIIDTPLDLLNHSIQSINLPGMGFEAVEQQQKDRQVVYRDSKHIQELFQKEMTVTFKFTDGYINYWMMMDILNYYYSLQNREPFIEDLNLRITDAEGYSVVTGKIKRPLLQQLSDINLNFSSNTAEFNTFDLTILYNEFEIKIELD